MSDDDKNDTPFTRGLERELERVYAANERLGADLSASLERERRVREALVALRDLPVVGPACAFVDDDEDGSAHEAATCTDCKAEAAYRAHCAAVDTQVSTALTSPAEPEKR